MSLEIERDVFSAVVSMCKERILLWLRLAHSKRGVLKRSIQQALRSAVECLNKLCLLTSDFCYKLLCSFTKEAKLVIRLADDWVNHQTFMQLKKLVNSIYNLQRAVDTQALLSGLTSQDMDPTS